MHLQREIQLGHLLQFRATISDDSKTNANGTDNSQDNNPDASHRNYTAAIVIAVVVVSFSVIVFAWIGYRRWRRTRTAKYSRSGRDDNDHSESASGPATSETPSSIGNQTAASTVDRNTSVRSVMTLPPYRPRPLEDESVLGREGERDGIDVVVEMPTAEEEETLREEEMDALYQIRLARRRHQEERQERREARQEARTRGDQQALSAIRQQSRTASANYPQELETLRNGHSRVQGQRQRAVSSVSYASLGVARHDGTRIRANSNESERIGLLSDVASVDVSGRSPSALSQSSQRPDVHQRGRSSSSVVSMNSTHSDDPTQSQQLGQQQLPQGTRSRASSTGTGRAGSSPELIDAAEADMSSGGDLPSHSPPGYDEVSLNDLTPAQSRSDSPYPEPPPVYEYAPSPGPTETRNRRLSARIVDLVAEASAADASAPTAEAGGNTTRSSSDDSQANRRHSRQSGTPQLPSLRLGQLPQIVIEPSSAIPRDNHEQ